MTAIYHFDDAASSGFVFSGDSADSRRRLGEYGLFSGDVQRMIAHQIRTEHIQNALHRAEMFISVTWDGRFFSWFQILLDFLNL